MKNHDVSVSAASRKESRLSRLLGIILILRSKEWISAEGLAGRFDVSLRTIYRDVGVLQANGVPIEGFPGPSGGYRLAGENPLPPLLFGNNEAWSLYALGELGTTGGHQARNALGPESTTLLERAKSRLYFDTSDWYWRTEGTDLLPSIREAVFQSSELRIFHRDRGRHDILSVEMRPLGLAWKGGQWYVVGQRKPDLTVVRIRLNRIISSEPVGLSFSYPEGFDLRQWWSSEIENFGKGNVRVTLIVSAAAQEELQSLAIKSTSSIEYRNDLMVVRLYVDKWDWLIPLVMSFGQNVYIEEPAALREELVSQLSSALGQYQSDVMRGRPLLPNDDSSARASRSRVPHD
ncbi:helix-turn-helix transcriptional regulator [Brevundimonas sp.]|uniref:helix-turn-helix transcriptional regulator n=1 Tax=Brevundimonas sp. TaxID=1871086 RepID=UPI003F723B42